MLGGLLRFESHPLCFLFGRQVGIVPKSALCHDSNIVPRMTELFAVLKAECDTLRIIVNE